MTDPPTLPKRTLAYEFLENFYDEYTELSALFRKANGPPRSLAEQFNLRSFVSSMSYNYLPPTWTSLNEFPRFSIIEFETVQDAREAYKQEFIDKRGGPPERIGNQGKWTIGRIPTADGGKTNLLSASQQVQNIIVDGIINIEDYRTPLKSLRSQIKSGENPAGIKGFYTFLLELSKYYRENKPYARTPVTPTKYNGLQRPFGDFNMETARQLVQDDLGELTKQGDENTALDCPVDVCRGFQFYISPRRKQWYDPVASADWFSGGRWGPNTTARVAIWAFAEPATLVGTVKKFFTHYWGAETLAKNEPTFLSLYQSGNSLELIGIDGPEGEILKFIISGNILVSLTGFSLPMPPL